MEKVDGGLYKPEFTAVESNLYREWTFGGNQRQRRSIYFEGIPEVYMNGS